MTDLDQPGFLRRLMDANALLREQLREEQIWREDIMREMSGLNPDRPLAKTARRYRLERDEAREECARLRREVESERSSRQAWAEEAAALKDAAREAYDELGDYIRVLIDVGQPSVAGRRVAAVKAQRIIGGYFGAVMSDWHDAEDRRVCACPTAEQLAKLGPRFSPPQCSVHPEPPAGPCACICPSPFEHTMDPDCPSHGTAATDRGGLVSEWDLRCDTCRAGGHRHPRVGCMLGVCPCSDLSVASGVLPEGGTQ